MRRATRRGFLFGAGSALASLAALGAAPAVFGGTERFLRRAFADHFGEDALAIDGIDDFISDYAATIGEEDQAKRLAAEYYFTFRADLFHKPGSVVAFEERFLRSVLSRSNIIAIAQGRAEAFDYQNPDPWSPECGLYLSALAEEDV